MPIKKNRARSNLSRSYGKAPESPRILIICEGKETEPNYFNGLRQSLRLSTVNCMIIPSGLGPTPDKVVAYAENLVLSDTWDEAWCVFDRDEHHHFAEAVKKARDLHRKIRNVSRKLISFKAIPSNPCFELWFLIHFEAWTREEHRAVIRHRLESYMPDYEKALYGMWSRLSDKLPNAFIHAKTLRRRQEATGNPNPSTEVDHLVERLLLLTQSAKWLSSFPKN